ncbi:MAG TPA: hypothetical protein DEO70_07130 [Bacteroidales bacterium]|nr:MAG: hypothetical protein A2X09_15825 [Bacteroidetes bacterium GWF2_43_11]HBZ66594.1 hypothetical protein [Bacteroidales bacterium]
MEDGSGPPIETDTREWTTYLYNKMREASQITQPNGAFQRTLSYQRVYTTEKFDGSTTSKEFDAAGRLAKITDNNQEVIEYKYTADGNTKTVIMNNVPANSIHYRYNIIGKVDSIQDPNMGKMTFGYSPYGDMIRQTNARNQIINKSYDRLGRPTVTSSPEGVARWYYDNPQQGIGQLDYSQFFPSGNEYGELTKRNRYDDQGRLIRSTQGIDGDTSSYVYFYNVYGQVKKTIYPSGFQVLTEYDPNGYTSKITNPDYGTIWELLAQNPFGSVSYSELGHTYSNYREFNPKTNRLIKNRLVSKITNARLHESGYSWNTYGNMIRRTDSLRGLAETFTYTGLNQLENSYLNGTLTSHIIYEDLGNIESRSDVGNFSYGESNAGPQAVTAIETEPGVFPSTVQNLQYTSFDKIKEMTENPWTLKVLYDEAGQKLLQTTTNTQTLETTSTLYQGFSERVTGSITEKTIDYITSPEGVVAIFSRNGDSDSTLHFLFKDYAGSIIGVMNPTGTYAQEISYDAWGRRRNPATWQPFTGTTPQALYTRGYTMHEHLSNFGLIDMKGRVYDPLVGRFLSPDPFIQAPEFSLSFNRYSYCLNNPLLYTDPTGFFAEGPGLSLSGPDAGMFYNDLGSANGSTEANGSTTRQTNPEWWVTKEGEIIGQDGSNDGVEYVVSQNSDQAMIRTANEEGKIVKPSELKGLFLPLPKYELRMASWFLWQTGYKDRSREHAIAYGLDPNNEIKRIGYIGKKFTEENDMAKGGVIVEGAANLVRDDPRYTNIFEAKELDYLQVLIHTHNLPEEYSTGRRTWPTMPQDYERPSAFPSNILLNIFDINADEVILISPGATNNKKPNFIRINKNVYFSETYYKKKK